MTKLDDSALMGLALAEAEPRIGLTSPNPWVGAALRTGDGRLFCGTTEAPGGRHAEVVAIDAARRAEATIDSAATLAVTLEPCNHHGRTGPCTEAILNAGIGRVLVGVIDPDLLVSGTGIARLRSGGVEVEVGVEQDRVSHQLAAYLHHRRTGLPWVTLKLAATIDGVIAAPDGSSQWITGPEARLDSHRLRARHDAVIVGAGTVRSDDPSLTVRLDPDDPLAGRQPQRIVLGSAPRNARIHPCRQEAGSLVEVLDRIGSQPLLSVMVEGGAAVAGQFHREGLVNAYVIYLAPALAGGSGGTGLFAGPAAWTIDEFWRGSFTAVTRLGRDLRLDMTALAEHRPVGTADDGHTTKHAGGDQCSQALSKN